ncbi:MAG: MFS transporter [Acidimicrobiales bacterium]|nr:MFS transporter [Acidimicrobiales bacterium]MDP6297879.1 MFS transporter [Acidimicrobiales bacterium]HJM29176.1 MFS transporter [Acidimicrobiales bacterium]HJM97588.1 MFS transporter [Acidimicrobiales bacterium]
MATSTSEANNNASIWSGKLLPITLANLTVVAVAAFDGLAIVAALPNITKDLGNVSLTPWVITSFLATSAIAAIAAGPIIDAIGVRKTFRITGIWFLLTSLAAAVAPNLQMLIIFRALQGIGGGLVIAVALASVGLAYPDSLRPQAFAANSMVWGTLGLGGPALAAVLLEFGGWRLIFFVQLPITTLALFMGWGTLPDTDETRRLRDIEFDATGITVLSVAITSSLVAVTQIASRWIASVILFSVAFIAARVYWSHSGRHPKPVLERQHLTRFPLNRIHLVAGLAVLTGLAIDNYLPLYMQTTRGRSETLAAFSVVFVTVGWTISAFLASRLLNSRKEEEVILLGSLMMPLSVCLAGTSVALGWALPVLFFSFFLVGFSIGFISTSGLTLLQSKSDPSEMGRSNSAHQFIRTLSISYGVAMAGAILLAVVNHKTGDVEAVRNVLSGENLSISDSTSQAIGSGFAWIHVLGIGTSLIGMAVAISLIRKSKLKRILPLSM